MAQERMTPTRQTLFRLIMLIMSSKLIPASLVGIINALTIGKGDNYGAKLNGFESSVLGDIPGNRNSDLLVLKSLLAV